MTGVLWFDIGVILFFGFIVWVAGLKIIGNGQALPQSEASQTVPPSSSEAKENRKRKALAANRKRLKAEEGEARQAAKTALAQEETLKAAWPNAPPPQKKGWLSTKR